MSNVLKNKMYDYEVTPPASAWEKVAVSLDEINSQKSIVKILYTHEAMAPAGTWSKIANTLDVELQETKFRSDVLNLEVAPPSFTWNKIAEQLDTLSQENFSKRVYDYEVAPPANSWSEIVVALDEKQTTSPAIPIRKNYSRLFRIAAAAGIIGIIAWAGFNLLNNGKSTTDENNIVQKDVKTIVPATPTPAIETKQSPATEEIKENTTIAEATTETATVTPATNDVRKWTKPLLKKQQEPVYTFAETESHSSSDDIVTADTKSLHSNKRKTVATATTDTNTDTRYLVYLTEQGDIVKLSKKLADLKCIYAKDGTVSQDALAKLDAAQCNDQVKFWQEKMANSSLQSSSNPLELIEILK
jgi:hypothetical protein